jgi:peptidoglycan hydrolase CwlO-like protein
MIRQSNTALTYSSARTALASLRGERRRLVDCCRALAADLEFEKRNQSSEGSKKRAGLRERISKLKSDLESLDGEIAIKEAFIRHRQQEIGGLGLRKQQLEAALRNGYYETVIAQAQNALRRAEADKQAAYEEVNNLESQIEELVR